MIDALDFSFHHAGICVADLEAAIDWYGDVLDFSLERRTRIEAARSNVAIIRKGDLRIELFETEGAKPLPEERRVPNLDLQTVGNKHVAFMVEDLGEALDELKARGADVAMEYQGRVFFIRDNSGNLIEFVSRAINAL